MQARTIAEHFIQRDSFQAEYRLTLLPEYGEPGVPCNSEFYGAYENTEAQARGKAVKPSLE